MLVACVAMTAHLAKQPQEVKVLWQFRNMVPTVRQQEPEAAGHSALLAGSRVRSTGVHLTFFFGFSLEPSPWDGTALL